MVEERENLLNQLQLYQQQIQVLLAQRESLGVQLKEINDALEAIEKSKEDEIFKVSGYVLIKEKRKNIEKELKEKKEMINLRLRTLENQEQMLKKKFDEIKSKVGL